MSDLRGIGESLMVSPQAPETSMTPKQLECRPSNKLYNITLIASDLLMFSRFQQLEQERNAKRLWRNQQLNLITMSMDDWIEQPGKSMYKFLEFVFHDHMPDYKKNTPSGRDRKAFFRKSQVSNHIATGMSADTSKLIE